MVEFALEMPSVPAEVEPSDGTEVLDACWVDWVVVDVEFEECVEVAVVAVVACASVAVADVTVAAVWLAVLSVAEAV